MNNAMQISFPVTIVVQPHELDLILKLLEKEPYYITRPIMDNLHPQILKQAQAHYGQYGSDNGAQKVGGVGAAGPPVPDVQGSEGPVDARLGISSGSQPRWDDPPSGGGLLASMEN